MSSTATLNSRLRVLVAKAFRAEKLYGAARAEKLEKQRGLKARSSKTGESMSAQVHVSDTAQELRAKEWQRSHYELRVALNNILALGNSKEQATQLLLLKNRYEARASEHAQAVRKLVESIKETADRQEFAHVLKLALEVIRLKAVAQSSKVITEELQAVLQRSGRTSDVGQEVLEGMSEPQEVAEVDFYLPENVVSLAERRAVRGGR